MQKSGHFLLSLTPCVEGLVGAKIEFTLNYNLQSDLAERANRQVLEALRAAVSTVAQGLGFRV